MGARPPRNTRAAKRRSRGWSPPTASTAGRRAGRRSKRGPATGAGKVRIGHDPKLEKDGLLARARAARALGRADAVRLSARRRDRAREQKDDAQEFEVAWPLPTPMRGVGLGALAAGAAGARRSAVASVDGLDARRARRSALLGAAAGLALARDRARRIETAAQAMRVQRARAKPRPSRDRRARRRRRSRRRRRRGSVSDRRAHGLGRERRHLRGDADHRRAARRDQAAARGDRARRRRVRSPASRGRGARPLVASERRRGDRSRPPPRRHVVPRHGAPRGRVARDAPEVPACASRPTSSSRSRCRSRRRSSPSTPRASFIAI